MLFFYGTQHKIFSQSKQVNNNINLGVNKAYVPFAICALRALNKALLKIKAVSQTGSPLEFCVITKAVLQKLV